MTLTILGLWLLCGIISGIIGVQKGEGVAGFLSGLVYGPYGIIITVFTKITKRRCPRCKKLIHKKAVVCPYCGQEVL